MNNSAAGMKAFRAQWAAGSLVLWLLLPGPADAQALRGSEPVAIGSQRELFIEDSLIERLEQTAELRLHHPQPQNVVLVHDAPWEGNASAYHSVFRDGDRYRMYYRAWRLTYGEGQLSTSRECLCYAESDDGIHWRKPDLGLHEFNGSHKNNIVIPAEWAEKHQASVHAPAVFRDDNPATPPEGRYKLFLVSNAPLGMRPFQSPDGLRWSPVSAGPTITDGAFDSHNVVFWDAGRSQYRAYWRYFTKGVTNAQEWKPDGVRAIRTAVSDDLLTWEWQANLSYRDSPEQQLYENGVAPYHRAPHLFVGFPVRYIDRGLIAHSTSPGDGSDRLTPEQVRQWTPSLRALPELEHRALRARLSERYGSALTETLLMASRDGVRFKRWDEAFLRPGVERPGTWNYGQHLVAWRPVETQSPLDGAPNELSIYTTEGYSTAVGTALRRYTLRLDGFVSVHAAFRGGELVTRPLTFSGSRLTLNLSTSAAGDIRVELQDVRGQAIPGFRLSECPPLFGDTLDRTVTWTGNQPLQALNGKPVRLRFVLRDADLYSFQFTESPDK